MSDINISKCPSCGAANMQEFGENRTNCIQCGANLSIIVKKGGGLKKFLSTALILVLLSSAGFYYVSSKTEEVLQEITKPSEKPVAPNVSIKKTLNAIPKLKDNAMTITSDQFKQSQDKQNIAGLQVVNSVSAKKDKGGQFWIVTIENLTTKSITRPRVVLKLLNKNNEQIESYSAWSKLEALPPGKTTTVLIDLPKIPKEEFLTEILAQSSPASLYDKAQQNLVVQDFQVSILDEEQIQFELTGTVYNPFAYQVDFVEIIALAKDKQGKSVGYAKAYASTTNIQAKQTSPFTIKANKYVTQTPYSWTLSAMARKH
jgi:hypothetical protein